MDTISVLVVDDEPLLVQAYSLILNSDPSIEVVGSAADGASGVAEYERLRPDVVLMDLRMPVMNGVEATGRIVSSDPEAKILVITSMTTEEHLAPALAHGASGYLSKDTDGERLKQAIRDVAAGTVALSPRIARDLVELVRENLRTEATLAAAPTPGATHPPLTPREQDVLELLAEGLTNQEMAERLYLSDSTVKSNLARVMQKLGTTNRVQALVVAVRHGLVNIGP